MKKLLVFLAILFVSVMSSACINNLAIQELNDKAKSLLEQGNYEEAIKRLESSVDLDGSVFETRYNLAVAYVGVENYVKAIQELNFAVKINPDVPDAYYTLGVAHEGLASEIAKKSSGDDEEAAEKKEEIFEPKVAQKIANELQEAVDAYNKYLEIGKNINDRENVELHVKGLNGQIEEYVTKYIAPFALNGNDVKND